jgi:xanthine dehydrogenase accessory factor
MFNDRTLAEKARQLEAEGIPYALATVVRYKSPTSARPGYKALVTAAGDIHGWIGGGCVQPAVIKTASQALRDGVPQLIRVSPVEGVHPEDDVTDFKSACYSGGTLDVFIEPMLSRPALLLLGSSEVAKSLAALAHFAGFSVTVASPAADEASFPWADLVITEFDAGNATFASVPLVVVATQGKGDQAALQAALRVDTFHRSFIASERKAGKLKQVLKDKGHDPQAVDAIIAPAGLEIGASAPQEIAVSVLAGLIAARHAELETPAESPAQNKATIPADAAAVPEEAGQTVPGQTTADSGCCGSNPVT